MIFLTHYFWFAFVAGAMSSTVVIIVASITGSVEHLDLVVVISVVATINILATTIYFMIGRYAGKLLLPHISKHIHIETFMQKIVKKEFIYIIVYRFLPGLRFISPYIMGMTKIKLNHFLILNMIAGILWAVIFCSIGFAFGHLALKFLTGLLSDKDYFYLAGGFVVVIYILKKIYNHHRAYECSDKLK